MITLFEELEIMIVSLNLEASPNKVSMPSVTIFMMIIMKNIRVMGLSLLIAINSIVAGEQKRPLPSFERVDELIEKLMAAEQVPGIALAIIDAGEVRYIKSYGLRDIEENKPLESDTVMYGASLTKFVFATYVMQLVDEGLIDIDVSIADLLPKPLPTYEKYADLAGDDRWRLIAKLESSRIRPRSDRGYHAARRPLH